VNIKKDPLYTDPMKVEEIYSERDGVPIKYVTTTALDGGLIPTDVYYRETPHPEFGNRYFHIFNTVLGARIGNADVIEDLEFGMIEDKDGLWHLSKHRHDYVSLDGKAIDGGRAYVRGNGFEMFKVVDGHFIKDEQE